MGFLKRLFGSQPATQTMTATLLEPDRDDAIVEIVGESNYQEHLDRVGGGRNEEGPLARDHLAALIREPTNRWDRNAVMVQIEAGVVGYLSRDLALAYRPVLDALAARGNVLACQARLTGGWDRGGADRGTIGVILHLGSPVECILDILEVIPSIRADHRWIGQVIAFSGDSRCRVSGYTLDRPASIALAEKAGMIVHPRVTKKVQLLVDCDRTGASGNELKAREYGIAIVDELEFWTEIGLPVERLAWSTAREERWHVPQR